jgi:O-antigen/teichoic acid export membrane protein
MKTRKSPVVGFLRGALKLLTENWGLKLLALLIAIILYHSLSTEDGYYHSDNDRQLFQYR